MAKQLLVFRNDGLIELEAITIFGVSVKNNDNPIGYFGTGLKYAIAGILRFGGSITIYRGEEKYLFETKEKIVRGECFEVVTMNGEELGFTTATGKNWERWMIFRELCSNCLDEGGRWSVVRADVVDVGLAEVGTTCIVVDEPGLIEVTEQSDRIFLDKEQPIEHMVGTLQVYPGTNEHLYYRGVRVYDSEKPFLKTYNIKTGIVLTEDRTFKNQYEIARHLANAIVTSQDRAFITEALTGDGFFENTVYLPYASYAHSEEFDEVLVDIYLRNPKALREGAVRMAESLAGKFNHFKEFEMDDYESDLVARGIELLSKFGYDIGEYPVKAYYSLGPNVLGLAKDKTIMLSKKVFSYGDVVVAATLLEEYFHLKYGYSDCTREFQDFILQQHTSMMHRIAFSGLKINS